ncbi:hypothetical protein GL213_00800 [Halogeometricum borinquense]|nr:hypothetical protein [Halogeometricum borinquense]ELY26776.1 hypothetical protein C499_11236 [Halogeometricum borinquense DSM 11551]QIQ75207.1 hypothetical protein GL213_00800 [Halogeometricum borinquense]
MTPNVTAASDASRAEVMASVDSTPARSEFIIADISCDNAWLSMTVEEAPSLRDWA